MHEEVVRFGVSMETDLLQRFDERIARQHYPTRSEAIRDLIRRGLVEEEWAAGAQDVIGTVTLVYDHHVRNLTQRLNEFQHRHAGEVIMSSHVHLDRHNCLEVVVVRGPAQRVRDLADHLRAVRGVKHATLSATTTGAGLP